jgi:hypothetical protein
MNQIFLILLAFACGAVFDVMWVKCVDAVREHKPLRAANLSLTLYALTLLATVLVVNQEICAIVAYGVGNWAGTFFGVKKC